MHPYNIYKIDFEDFSIAGRVALVAAKSEDSAERILRGNYLGNYNQTKKPRFKVKSLEEISFKVWEKKDTGFKSNKEGVIYSGQ
ncbi:MAG: hypothetical protein Q8P15_02735 [Nanoarchaeota archaeon]|nr:hypothetical protein [Nanoarchaeota archaeon]